MPEYAYRNYERSDADGCVKLFSECFGKERRLDEWKWLYHDCPLGQRSVVCTCGDEIAGFYGVVCRQVLLGGGETLAGHVLDVMTHPRHQGKGVFSSSAKAAFEESRMTGVNLFFGFPNKLAAPGHKKVNWRFLGKRDILRMEPVKEAGLGGQAQCHAEVRDVKWESLGGIASDIDGMGYSGMGRLRFKGDRGARWIGWRYGRRPGFDYSLAVAEDEAERRPVGWMVYRIRKFQGRLVGHIVDYAARGDRRVTVGALLDHTIIRLSAAGCEFVQCLEDPDIGVLPSPDEGWRTEAERELHLIVRSTDADGSGTPPLSLDECRLTLGDCDVF